MTQRIPWRVLVALLFLVAVLLVVAVVLYTHVPLGHVEQGWRLLADNAITIMSRHP